MAKPKKSAQGKLRFKERNWGGARKGAGRKPKGPRPLGDRRAVPHHRRAEIERRHPVHVTVRMMPDVWNLRTNRAWNVLSRALLAVRETGARLTHYSVQGNHLHLILEVEHRRNLGRAMRSISIRVARGLNQLMRRSGRVVADRYHAAVLRTPTQVRNAIRYVLSNTRKHMLERRDPVGPVVIDRFAAGPQGQAPVTMDLRGDDRVLLEPRTWLLREGWSRRPTAKPVLAMHR
ncbi:transposase [Vulgatibacter sp.]|uniref:transposase n=1 Tax=Vulgatibacter sp. TaxID=1971226 RepID=UPI00356A2DBD